MSEYPGADRREKRMAADRRRLQRGRRQFSHWKDGKVIELKLKDDLFSLAQMRTNCLMEFFDAARRTPGTWEGVNLNETRVIFCAYVADNRIKPLFHSTVGLEKVAINSRPVPRLMLSFIVKGPGRFGADLVELDERLESARARVVQRDLDPAADRSLILAHEMTSMLGDPAKLRKRLVGYFETGRDVDDAKRFIFPQIYDET